MGLDVSISMICGVKASDVFTQGYREETQAIATVNALGEPTGKTSVLKEWFLECPLGSFWVGDNKKSLTTPSFDNRVEVTLSKIFGSKNEYDSENEWIHYSNWDDDDLSQYIIGLEIASIKYSSSGNEYNCQIPTKIPEELVSRVREELSTRFGYQGEINAIAVVNYSH